MERVIVENQTGFLVPEIPGHEIANWLCQFLQEELSLTPKVAVEGCTVQVEAPGLVFSTNLTADGFIQFRLHTGEISVQLVAAHFHGARVMLEAALRASTLSHMQTPPGFLTQARKSLLS